MVNQTLLCICWHIQCIWQCANPCYLGQTSVLKNKATQQAFQARLCQTLFALVWWKWLLTKSKSCSAPGLWPLQGAGLPGTASPFSSWLLKVRPRNPLPSTWGMPRGSTLHEFPITASWPWPQNWLILTWQYPLISCLPARSHSGETEKQMGHKKKPLSSQNISLCIRASEACVWAYCMNWWNECSYLLYMRDLSFPFLSRYRLS